MPLARELRDIAKELGLRGYSKMNKTQLTDAIEGHVQHGKAEVKKSEPTEPAPEPTKPAPRRTRASTSPWVEFCRTHAKEQGITYKEAMSKKDDYLKWKESRSTPVTLTSREESIPEE